jgi:hypothetical protein
VSVRNIKVAKTHHYNEQIGKSISRLQTYTKPHLAKQIIVKPAYSFWTHFSDSDRVNSPPLIMPKTCWPPALTRSSTPYAQNLLADKSNSPTFLWYTLWPCASAPTQNADEPKWMKSKINWNTDDSTHLQLWQATEMTRGAQSLADGHTRAGAGVGNSASASAAASTSASTSAAASASALPPRPRPPLPLRPPPPLAMPEPARALAPASGGDEKQADSGLDWFATKQGKAR